MTSNTGGVLLYENPSIPLWISHELAFEGPKARGGAERPPKGLLLFRGSGLTGVNIGENTLSFDLDFPRIGFEGPGGGRGGDREAA